MKISLEVITFQHFFISNIAVKMIIYKDSNWGRLIGMKVCKLNLKPKYFEYLEKGMNFEKDMPGPDDY